MTYGNGTYTDYTYDNLNQIKSLLNKKSGTDVLSGYSYQYDNASMITKIRDNQGNVSNYDYDEAYQLKNEHVIDQTGKTLWHNKFTYDNSGNRLTLEKNGIVDHYSYNINNQLTSITKTSINVNGIVNGDSSTRIYVENIKAKTYYLGNNQVSFEAYDIPLDQSKDSLQLYAKVNEVLATVGDSAKFICVVKTSPDGTVNIYFHSDIQNVEPENINTIYIKKSLINYYYDNNGNLAQIISPLWLYKL